MAKRPEIINRRDGNIIILESSGITCAGDSCTFLFMECQNNGSSRIISLRLDLEKIMEN